MGIYAKRKITERIEQTFTPARLYIKTLRGKYYFGKTIAEDVYSYCGSGKLWKEMIRKHGKEQVKTLWVSDWYNSPHEIQEVALHFSEENQIVESRNWANLKPEDGLDGGIQSIDTIKRISSKNTGQKRTLEQNEAKSKRQTGSTKSQSWIDNRPGYDKTMYDWLNIDTGEVISMIRRDFAKQYIAPLTKYFNQTVYEMTGSRKRDAYGWRYLGETEILQTHVSLTK